MNVDTRTVKSLLYGVLHYPQGGAAVERYVLSVDGPPWVLSSSLIGGAF